MRGIIADCTFRGDDNSISISGGIDPFRLRQYLLYWDNLKDYAYLFYAKKEIL